MGLAAGIIDRFTSGGYTGAHLAIVANNRWIKRVFEVVTISVGIKLILG